MVAPNFEFSMFIAMTWCLDVAPAGTGLVMSYVYITLLRFRAAMLVQMGMFILSSAPLGNEFPSLRTGGLRISTELWATEDSCWIPVGSFWYIISEL